MATSRIILYGDAPNYPKWKLLPEKLFVIEDIEEYLYTGSFYHIEVANVQYQKPTLELELKLDLSQVYAEPLENTSFKYVKIQDSTNLFKFYYYYVKKVEWRSLNSVRFVLVMDVLNTFKLGTDYSFNKKTHITREHKDRLIKRSSPTYTLHNLDLEPYIEATAEVFVDYGSTFLDLFALPLNLVPSPQYPYFMSEVLNLSTHEYEGRLGIALVNKVTGVRNVLFSPNEKIGYCYFTGRHYNTLTGITDGFTLRLVRLNGDIVDTEFVLSFSSLTDNYFEFFMDNKTLEEGEYSGDNSREDFWKDMFIPKYLTYEANNKYFRTIDIFSEGLTPTLYKEDNDTYINNTPNIDFYLIYRNRNEPTEALNNPVDCFICGSERVNVVYNLGSVINSSMLEDGKFYIANITTSNNMTFTDGSHSITITSNTHYAIFRKVGNLVQWTPYQAITSEIRYPAPNLWYNVISLSVSGTSPIVNVFKYDKFITSRDDLDVDDIISLTLTASQVIKSIQDIDRTEAKIIKIIKLPYSPFKVVLENNVIQIDNTIFEYDSTLQLIRLKDLNTKFKYTIYNNTDTHVLRKLYIDNSISGMDEARDDELEGKIYHSDFYLPKIVYDSFSFGFQLEKEDLDFFIDSVDLDYNVIDYVVTTTINSRFMFKFKDYISNLADQDYYNVMPIARNNEITLYNVPYINYIRTGYNYDVKSKNRNIGFSWAGAGISGVATVLGLAFAPAGLKIPAVIAGAVSIVSSLKSAINTTLQEEQNLQAKQTALRNQAVSVEGSDDVDLMSDYSNNRLKIVTYRVNDIMKNLLLDLFYYTGYNTNRIGIPNVTSRAWFNYVECDAIFDFQTNLSNEIVEELVSIYKTGVTFIHNAGHFTGHPNAWDIDQEKNNLELSIMED